MEGSLAICCVETETFNVIFEHVDLNLRLACYFKAQL